MGEVRYGSSFCDAVQEAYQTELALHQDLQLDLISVTHPLKELFENNLCSLPLVLVSKYVEPAGSVNTTPGPQMNSTMNNENNISTSDLAGSPMQLQEFSICSGSSFIANPTQKSLKPIKVIKARELISTVVMKNEENLPPVWFMCDGTDKSGITYVGFEQQKSEAQRVLNNFKVSTEGPFTGKTKLPKLESLAKRDLRKSNCKVSMQCFARYSIIDHVNLNPDSTVVSNKGSLELELQWSKSSSLLLAPPLDAYAVAQATVVAGDENSAAFQMHSELAILKNFANALQDGQVAWGAQENDGLSLVDRTRDLIERLKRGEGFDAEDGGEGADNDDEIFDIHNFTAGNRVDLDFTEHLWNVAKRCSSYRDLIDSLQLVFKCLQSGELQPMVHKENQCTLAKYIRQSYNGELGPVELHGLVPLELVCEIGVEKLRRDYINVMIGNDLAAYSYIEPLVQPSDNTIDNVERLEKLHHCLELVVMLVQYLNLPKRTLGVTARNAIHYFEKNPLNREHQFTVPVQASSVAQVIEKRSPCVWKADLKNKIGGVEEHAVYYISTKQQFGHIPSRCSTAENDDEHSSQPTFYLTRATQQTVSL